MTGSPTRFLAVGLALSGALLATTGLPAAGGDAVATSPSASPSASASAPAVQATSPARTSPAAATTRAARPTSTTIPTTTTGPAPSSVTVSAATAARVSASPARATAAAPTASAPATAAATGRAAARAASVGLCRGDGWQQRRGEAALRSLAPAAGNGYGLRFLPARSGFMGLTRPSLRMVEVYVRSCSVQSTELLRHVLAHELGHAYDKTRLTDAQRTAWMRVRGIPAGTTWYGCHRCTDFATPAGDFAEVYAQWRRGATSNRSQLGGAPSQAQLAALATQFFGA